MITCLLVTFSVLTLPGDVYIIALWDGIISVLRVCTALRIIVS